MSHETGYIGSPAWLKREAEAKEREHVLDVSVLRLSREIVAEYKISGFMNSFYFEAVKQVEYLEKKLGTEASVGGEAEQK